MDANSFGGPWTGDKLEILREYLDAYTTALKKRPFNLAYVGAFAGGGSWTPKPEYTTDDYGDFREVSRGSPRIALEIQDKAFDRLVFVEKDPSLSKSLLTLRREFPNRCIDVVNGDANMELPKFCKKMEDLDRAVIFLDPFATEVAWLTVEIIARTKKVDCWILFPLMAVARMMPSKNEPTPALANRLDRIFGGRERWHDIYGASPQLTLFDGGSKEVRPSGSEGIAVRYRERLESVFEKVAPTSRTFKNSKGSPMFELFFAASNPQGAAIAVRIANYILTRW